MEAASTLPTWVHGYEPTARRHRPLMVDTTTDVVVVGAGIAGLTTAFLLRREGYNVIVVDDGPVGGGETERTTAHLSNALDDRFYELEKLHGLEGARIAAESHTEAIALIEAVAEQLGIDCDFARLDGWLFCAPGDGQDVLQRELEAARRAGLHVELFNRVPDLGFDTGPALRFPRQGQLHPLKYLRGLANAFVDDGGAIYTGTHAAQIEGGTSPRIVTSDGHVIAAQSIVIATNSPVNDRFAVHTKQSAFRSYVVALSVAHGAVPPVLLWDTADPYHYVRLQRGEREDTLIVGGEDHKTGHVVDGGARFESLIAWARARFPAGDVVARWSGQIMEPVDGLAFIGRDPAGQDNVYVATGDSGHGMTHGTIAGMLITDLIGGIDHPWAKLYDPRRKPLNALGRYAADAIANTSRYVEHLKPGPQLDDLAELGRGEGMVAKRGMLPIAVYVDERGERHTCSAVCPHLGGKLEWNPTEKSFDCPVHGSRFDCTGKVINGPANTDLKKIEEPAPAGVEIPSRA